VSGVDQPADLAELLQSESPATPGLEQLLTGLKLSASQHEVTLRLRLESDAERVQIVTIHTSAGWNTVACLLPVDGRVAASA
jgi:ATP-dependent exoDNAse (exonuclease V) beta subunit